MRARQSTTRKSPTLMVPPLNGAADSLTSRDTNFMYMYSWDDYFFVQGRRKKSDCTAWNVWTRVKSNTALTLTSGCTDLLAGHWNLSGWLLWGQGVARGSMRPPRSMSECACEHLGAVHAACRRSATNEKIADTLSLVRHGHWNCSVQLSRSYNESWDSVLPHLQNLLFEVRLASFSSIGKLITKGPVTHEKA